MTLFLLAVSLLYAFFTFLLWMTWLRMPAFVPGIPGTGSPAYYGYHPGPE